MLDLVKFVTKGLGNQVGLHVYDAPPMFDLNTPQLLGLMLGSFNGNNRQFGGEEVWISFLVTSLNSPAYIALPVQDEKIVDDFLDQLDKVLPPLAKQHEQAGFIRFEQDFYKTKLKNKEETPMRCYSFSIGPVKWRLFWRGSAADCTSPASRSFSTTWPPRTPSAPTPRTSRRPIRRRRCTR